MSNTVVALLFSLGAATWVYGRFMRTTGSNTKNSLIAAVAIGILLFIVLYFVMGFIADKL